MWDGWKKDIHVGQHTSAKEDSNCQGTEQDTPYITVRLEGLWVTQLVNNFHRV
jgi:hypothetical protein